MHLLALLGIMLGGLSATGILVNRTIDDMYGDQVTGAQVRWLQSFSVFALIAELLVGCLYGKVGSHHTGRQPCLQ